MIRNLICYCVFLLLSAPAVRSQLCRDVAQYSQCSTSIACGCFHMINSGDIGICGFLWPSCSQLVPCNSLDNTCHQSNTVCVRHPRCQHHPICYPVSMIAERICPPISMTNTTTTPTITTTTTTQNPININSKWIQNGITIAGGNGVGKGLNQLFYPYGIYIDDDDEQTIYIADYGNSRIFEWKYNAINGQLVAGQNSQGSSIDYLNSPTDVIFDKNNDSFIICDGLNRRVVRWSRRTLTYQQTIVSNIDCMGLAIDINGDLYVSDRIKTEVKRWREGERNGTIVAGGNQQGYDFNQLNYPTYIFVDRNFSVYVSDASNHRVMKWVKDAKEGIIVAGGQGEGNSLTQLSRPMGVIVDHLGNVYVSDFGNHRIMRWLVGEKEGKIIAAGNGEGKQSNQLHYPMGLSFDREGNLYVVDEWNNRVQKFLIDLD